MFDRQCNRLTPWTKRGSEARGVGLVVLVSVLAWSMAGVDVRATEPVETDPLTVAVIPVAGEETADAVAALLTQGLADRADVRLVERAAVSAVLAEQELMLGGLATFARELGPLVGADALVVVESTRLDPPSVRLRTVETRTGIVLDETLASLEQAVEPAATARLVRAGLVRAQRPLAQRHHVAVVGVMAEKQAAATRKQAALLEPMLRVALAGEPGLVLLEREQLDRLRQEEALADLAVTFRASTHLVEVGVRRGGAGAAADDADQALQATLVLRSLAGDEPRTQVVTLPADAPREAGDRLVQALREALGAEAAGEAMAPSDAATEARALFERARWRWDLDDNRGAFVWQASEHTVQAGTVNVSGQGASAMSLLHAAIALDPQPEYRLEAGQWYAALANRVETPWVVGEGIAMRRPTDGHGPVEPDHALADRLRLLEVAVDQELTALRALIAADRVADVFAARTIRLRRFRTGSENQQLQAAAERRRTNPHPDRDAVLRRILEKQATTSHLLLSLAREHPAHGYPALLQEARLARFVAPGADSYHLLIQDQFRTFETLRLALDEPRQEARFRETFVNQVLGYRMVLEGQTVIPAETPGLADWLQQQGDPAFAFAGRWLALKANAESDAAQAAHMVRWLYSPAVQGSVVHTAFERAAPKKTTHGAPF